MSPARTRRLQDVDLQVAEPQHRRELDGVAVGPPHDRQGPRDELLGREGDGEDVVHAALEGRQLRLEVAPPRERDDAGDGRPAPRGELVQDRAPGDVHVENREMRLPLGERGAGALDVCATRVL